MESLFYALASAFVISLISLSGAFSLAISEKILSKLLIFLVSFSAGSLMGGAFFHLLPEALAEDNNVIKIFIYLLCGFCLFFILERVLRWRHCHEGVCETHQHLGWLNLVGDGIHNVIDGLVLMSAFAVSPALGFPVAFSIIFHEIPQELGDFGVMIYSGFKRSLAILYNFITGLLALAGVLAGFFIFDRFAGANQFLLAFAAGGFIYIAASDLIPEIHQDKNVWRSLINFFIFLAALGLMLVLKIFGAE